MSDVSHGVNAGKTDSGAITPVSVDTGVHFVVGTAPVLRRSGAGVGIFRRMEKIQPLRRNLHSVYAF